MEKLFQILKWMMLSVLLVVLLAFTNKKQQQQQLSLVAITVQESVDDFVNKQIVLAYLKNNNISVDSIFLTESYLSNMEELLLEHPSVKNAEVYSKEYNELTIHIAQRKAIVRIKTAYEDYYLDDEGEKMPLSSNYTPRLLLVSGDVSARKHKAIFDFVTKINKDNFWKAQFTQLHFTVDELVIIPRVGEQKIHFGRLVNIDDKLDKLYQFYRQAMPVKGWQTYSDISLKYNNQIVCTKNK